MATKRKKPATSKPRAPRQTPKKRGDGRAYKTFVKALRKSLQEKLEKNIRASLSDYIRLVQLEKELQTTEAKETKATWVDPKTEGSESGESITGT